MLRQEGGEDSKKQEIEDCRQNLPRVPPRK